MAFALRSCRELDLELKRAQENDNVSLGLLVAQRMLASTKHYAMQHALLSALPCTEVDPELFCKIDGA